MIAADRILDIGPGPGERGGQIVFDGTPAQLRNADTLTGNYQGSRLRVEAPRPMPVAANTPRLLLEGARANNLKNVSKTERGSGRENVCKDVEMTGVGV